MVNRIANAQQAALSIAPAWPDRKDGDHRRGHDTSGKGAIYP